MSSSSVSGLGSISRFEAFKANVSNIVEVAFPKIHALFETNYKAAQEANRPFCARVLNEVKFNDFIDAAIKKLDVKEGEAGYLPKNQIIDVLRRLIFDLSPDLGSRFTSGLLGVEVDSLTPEEIKTLLLTLKINAQIGAGSVVKLINLSTSLANTAALPKKVECTDLGAERLSLRLERVQKINAADNEYQQSYNQLAELEKLLGDLAGINDRTLSNDIDAFFAKFLELKPSIMRLIGTGNEQAEAVTSLLDQIDGSPESKIAFFKDLQNTESDYFKILMRSVVKARQEVIEKADLLNLAHREVRTEGFDKFDLRFDPRTGIIFKDVFNKCNNLEAPTKLLSKLVQWLNTSLIDPSKGSFLATTANVALVGLFVIFKMAQAVVSFGLASICYLGGSAAWGIGKAGRYIFGQGFDRLKDHFKKTHIPKNNNLELQGLIANSDRPTNLLAGLRMTDFYRAYEAAVKIQAFGRGINARKQAKAKAEAAVKIQAFGRGINARKQAKAKAEAAVAELLKAEEAANDYFAQEEKHKKALAVAKAYKDAQAKGQNLLQSLQVSKRVGVAAPQEAAVMFRSQGSNQAGGAGRQRSNSFS